MLRFYIKFFAIAVLGLGFLKAIDTLCVQNEFFYTTYHKFFDNTSTYDFVFMGNSLSQTTYNHDYIDSLYNARSFNLGGSAHNFLVTDLIFKELISRPELYPTKLLVIEIGSGQFKELESDKLKFLQMAPLDEIDYSIDYFKAISKIYNVSEYPKVLSPTIRFHNELDDKIPETSRKIKTYRNINVDGFTVDRTTNLTPSLRSQKTDLSDVVDEYNRLLDQSTEQKIEEYYEAMIIHMIESCAKRGINLLFVTAPSIATVYQKEDYGSLKYIENLLESKSAHYINFNRSFKELGLTFDDFTDFSHLNVYGNRKVTPLLLNYVKNNFDISKNLKTIRENSDKKVEFKNDSILTDISNWRMIRSSLVLEEGEYYQNPTYRLSRATTTQSALVNLKRIIGEADAGYEISIIAKRGEGGNRLGMRISGKYPNRTDAIFDLKSGSVVGVSKYGNFENEFAKIEPLNDGWYRCILSAKVNTVECNVFMGPTDDFRKVSGWEGDTKKINDVLIVPLSLDLNKREYRSRQ